MSRWAPDLQAPHQTPDVNTSAASGGAERNSARRPGARGVLPFGARIVPYFASAVLFLSAFFAVFAPIPILIHSFRRGRSWAWLAALTNGTIVFLLGGVASFAIFAVFVIALALGLAEGFRLFRKPERAAVFAWGVMAVIGLGWTLVHFNFSPAQAWSEAGREISVAVDALVQTVPPDRLPVQVNGPEDIAEWKRSLLVEMPSAIAILSLIAVWASTVVLLRLNPGQIREKVGLGPDFFQTWKAPEFLVWPTLVSGFFLLVGVKYISPVALNLFKVLMTIYALQGLSILAFFFDLWGVRGLFRTAGYVLVGSVMTPLLLSLGFFDLWFDFRSKFRQT